MSLFEFMMIVVSIIVGLGLAEILTGVARLIRDRSSISGYWVHSFLIAIVFTALLQQWWEIWDLQRYSEWTFFGAVMMLTGPMGLFLIAHLLFPASMRDADLEAYYYGALRPVWWLALVTIVLATVFRPLVFGMDLLVPDHLSSLVGAVVFTALGMTQRRLVHAVLVPVFFAAVIADVVQFSFVLRAN